MIKVKHRRVSSDTNESSLAKRQIEPLPGLKENCYDSKSANLVLVSPSVQQTNQQKRISYPTAADPEKTQEFSLAKQNTIQQMCEEASKEYIALKQQFIKKPTEINQSNLESKVKVMRRLQSQISQQYSDPDLLSPSLPVPFRNHPTTTSHFYDNDEMTDSQSEIFKFSTQPRKQKIDIETPGFPSSDSGSSSIVRLRNSVCRSHSDRCLKPLSILKNISDEKLRLTSSTDEIFKGTHSEFRDSGKFSSSVDISSDVSSDTTNEPLSPARSFSTNPDLGMKKPGRILALDDCEFLSDDEDIHEEGGPFSDFNVLKSQSAHLAIFLHYLISNSDPSPLLFYLITDMFQHGSGRDMVHRWAYEIYCNFLAESAPLKVEINKLVVDSIRNVIQTKQDKEETVKMIFRVATHHAEVLIKELLNEFGIKRQIGLGNIYGNHELRDNMDRASELKIVETALWKHFEDFIQDKGNERSLVMASCLATFFKRVGYISTQKNLQERCSTFNAHNKNKFLKFSKMKPKPISQQGHQLQTELYMMETYCQLCHMMLSGVGNQGYQCNKCEQNFHKICLDRINKFCTGKKSSRLDKDYPKVGSNNFDFVKPVDQPDKSISSVLSSRFNTSSKASKLPEKPLSYIDCDCEEELPLLENAIPKDILKKKKVPTATLR